MRNLPVVTKNLLLINLAIYLLDLVLRRYGVPISMFLGLCNATAYGFHWWQPFTYMFLHANFSHLFFNMFAVLMFAPALEESWGSRRFLTYYLVCGVGAALVQLAVWALVMPGQPAVTIGASGAVFGILFAFGWLFPEVRLFLLFIPIPIRSRVFVAIYAAIELFAGIGDVVGVNADNVAHFAHLGGMLFGWLLILWWRNSNKWHLPKWGKKHDTKEESRYGDYHYQEPLR